MLKQLIISQNKALYAHLDPNDSVEPLLGNLKRKDEISTAVVLLEGQTPPAILFIFQNTLYAPYRMQDNGLKPISFSDYFEDMSRAYGVLNLYPISPVLFKALLILAQSKPTVVVSSDMINNTRLLGNIEGAKKEAVMTIEWEEQFHLFYFREGALCDGYFEAGATPDKHAGLRKTLLDFTKCTQDPPVQIALYEQFEIAPANDQDQAEEHIASITPSDFELWTHAEEENEDPDPDPKNGQWTLEVLSGDQAGSTITLTKKRTTIGRGMGEIRLNDPQISRHHAELELSSDALTISDKKSTNGSFVNDERISKKKVSADDTIRLGDTTLKVRYRS